MIPRNLAVTLAILCSLTFGMSLYLWQLRRREATNVQHQAVGQHVTAPSSGPTESITLVVAHDDTSDLRARSIKIPVSGNQQERAEEILRLLLTTYQAKDSPHPLTAAAEIRNVYLVQPGIAVVDVNSAFVDSHTSGIMAEELMIVSLVQTLSLNLPNITGVKMLVDGKERETLAGHIDLSGVLSTSDISQLANQLLSQ